MLGGLLTDVLSWRWCLYVNLLIAIPAVFFALRSSSTRAPAAATDRLRRRRARVHRPVRDRLRVLQGRDRCMAGTRDDRLARGGRRAAHRVRVHERSGSTSRCCPCIVWDRARGALRLDRHRRRERLRHLPVPHVLLQQNLGYSP
jgi:hypothetical protein